MSDIPPAPPAPNLGALDYTFATLETHRIDYSRITIQESVDELGSGAYGTVVSASLQDTDAPGGSRRVAVKMLRCVTGNPQERLQIAFRLAREVNVWAGLDHPNILPLIGFNLPWDLNTAWIICPYEANGNAVEYLARIMPDMATRLKLVLDIANGLAYLHGRNPPVVHGDLKGTNILIGHSIRAMLCDFGLAKALNGAPSGLTSTRSIKGTLRYLSPELVMEDEPRLTLESDMWAWGCLAAEVLTDRIPFHNVKGDAGVIRSLLKNERPASVDDISVPPPVRDVVHKCWDADPVARPEIQECVDVVSLSTSVTVDLLSNPRPDDVPPSLKKSGDQWVAIFASAGLRRMFNLDHLDLELDYGIAYRSTLALQFSADGSCLALGRIGRAVLLDVGTGASICAFPHGPEESLFNEIVYNISFSSDGKLLVTSGVTFPRSAAAVRIWDIASCTCLQTFPPPEGSGGSQSLASFSPQNTFVVYSFTNDVHIYDHIGDAQYTISALSPPSQSRITSLTISPDSRHVATGYQNGSVRIANVYSGTLLATLNGGIRDVHSLAYTPDGKRLVSLQWGEPPIVWAPDGLGANTDGKFIADAQPTSRERTLEVPQGDWVESMACSPDGAWIIALLEPSKRVMMWNAVTGKAEVLLHIARAVLKIAVSPVATESGYAVASLVSHDDYSYGMRVWKFKSIR